MLHSAIGMNITDAAVIPSQLKGRTDRYLGDLSELIDQGWKQATICLLQNSPKTFASCCVKSQLHGVKPLDPAS